MLTCVKKRGYWIVLDGNYLHVDMGPSFLPSLADRCTEAYHMLLWLLHREATHSFA